MKNRRKARKILYVLVIFLITLIWYLFEHSNKNTITNNEQKYIENVTHDVPIIVQEDSTNGLDFSSMSEEEIQEYENWWREAKDRRTHNNVVMEIKSGTLTNLSVTLIISDNNEVPYEYGSSYRLDKKEKEGWKEVKRKLKFFNITDTISLGYEYYKVGKDGKVEITINWEEKYGKLKKGEYRLVKFIDNEEIYIEFVI